jgi:hypothetical protein
VEGVGDRAGTESRQGGLSVTKPSCSFLAVEDVGSGKENPMRGAERGFGKDSIEKETDRTHYRKGSQQRLHIKLWRARKEKVKLILSRYIGMSEASEYSLRGLVGRFGYRSMVARDIHRWIADCWGLVLGYLPEAFILPRQWYCFLF